MNERRGQFILGVEYGTWDINFSIHRAFADAGLEFAFPTQTLHVTKNPIDQVGTA
jgi:small-conductance mechanosensitive channel